MTKADFIREIANKLEISQREAKIVFEAMLNSMVRALRNGEHIEIRGFGTFGTHMRPSRQGRRPGTEVEIDVPAKRVPHFRAGLELREMMKDPVEEAVLAANGKE